MRALSERPVSASMFTLDLVGGWKEMTQIIQRDSAAKFLMGVAIVVVAAGVLAGAGAIYSLGRLSQHMDDSFCYVNQRLDRLEHQNPRQCS